MKTQEELNKLKEEYQLLTSKLNELTEEELKIVIGGIYRPIYDGSESFNEGKKGPASCKSWFGGNTSNNKDLGGGQHQR